MKTTNVVIVEGPTAFRSMRVARDEAKAAFDALEARQVAKSGHLEADVWATDAFRKALDWQPETTKPINSLDSLLSIIGDRMGL
jgi:hypothetical protein